MEQRRLRLGDIVDDYCPRERRITNHAVVAMIEDEVRQTRCGTCDAEHPYKGGHAPRRRKKEEPGALYKEVLAGMQDADAPAALATAPASAHSDVAAPAAAGTLVAIDADPAPDPVPAVLPPVIPMEDGPVHRPLIRATLPRIEGQKEVRQTPEFTIRQSSGRPPVNFRGADQRGKPRGAGPGQGAGQPGNRPQGGGRFVGGRTAGNQNQGVPGRRPNNGFRAAPPQGRDGGSRKRSR